MNARRRSRAAHARIAPHVRRTPLLEAAGVSLKLECLQHTGSFKPRGAFNNLLSRAGAGGRACAAASGGNHGAAVAYAAQQARRRRAKYSCLTSPRR